MRTLLIAAFMVVVVAFAVSFAFAAATPSGPCFEDEVVVAVYAAWDGDGFTPRLPIQTACAPVDNLRNLTE